MVNAEGSFKVTTDDGTINQITAVKNLLDVDLAVIELTSNTTYQVAELGDSQSIISGTNGYVVGYPEPIPRIPEKAHMFLDANIVSKLETGEHGYQIVHNNPTKGGSLIGINGRTTSDGEGRAYYDSTFFFYRGYAYSQLKEHQKAIANFSSQLITVYCLLLTDKSLPIVRFSSVKIVRATR